MAASAVIKHDIPIPKPEFMSHAVIRSLPENGPHISRFHINHPDPLMDFIPRPFVAEHGQMIICRRKLKMVQPAGIPKHLAKPASIYGNTPDPSLFDGVHLVPETCVIGSAVRQNIRLFIHQKPDPPFIGGK